MPEVKSHKHKWAPGQVAMLDAGYPNFVVRYFCLDDCDAEEYEVVEGSEL